MQVVTRQMLELTQKRSAPTCACILLLYLFSGLSGCNYSSQASSPTASRGETHTYNIGAIPKASPVRQLFVQITNRGDAPLSIDSWRTSCECVVAKPNQLIIDPGSTNYVSASLDMSHDPDFAGELKLVCEGVNANGDVLVAINILVNVVEVEVLRPAL